MPIPPTRLWIPREIFTSMNMISHINDLLSTLSGRRGPVEVEDSIQIIDGQDGNRYLLLPKGTTSQRPSNPSEGMVRYNTSINTPEVFTGSSWRRFTPSTPTPTPTPTPPPVQPPDPEPPDPPDPPPPDPDPLVVTISAIGNSQIEGQYIGLTANVSGGSGTGLTYTWSGTGVSGSGSSVDWLAPFVNENTLYTIGCVVRDDAGNIASDTIVLQSRNVTPPLTLSLSAGDASIDEEANTTITANVGGGDGNYLYYWYGTGISGSGSSVTWTAPSVSSDTNYTVTCQIYDGLSNMITRTITMTSMNVVAPPVTPLSWSPSTIESGHSSSGTLSSPSGGSGGYTYSWSTPSTINISGLSWSRSSSWTPGPAQSATGTVTDSNGNTLTKTVTIFRV